MSSKPILRLDWCSHEAAKYAVEKWHYSRSMPVGKVAKVGAWEDGKYIGCVLFARGANNNLYKPYGLEQTEGCELVRVALSIHQSPVSRIVRVALMLLKKQSPGMRLVVSFADKKHGHHGGIYQAGGWLFSGTIKPPTEYVWQGKFVHSMQIQTMIRSGHIKDRSGLQKRAGSSKHRYLMPLDAEMRAQIAPLAKPYPKRTRAGSDTLDTPANHAGEGGSIPTPALHLDDVNEAPDA